MSRRPRPLSEDARAEPPAASWGLRDRVAPDPLLLAVDLGLVAAIVVLPFIMGGRQAAGAMALLLIAGWTATATLLRRVLRPGETWRFSGLELWLLCGIALCAAQTIALPAELLTRVAPHLSQRLPLWDAPPDAGDGTPVVSGPWTTISLVPVATRRSLGLVVSIAMLFVSALQRMRTIDDIGRLLRLCATSAWVMALFGIVQFLGGNGKFFWTYEHPFTHTRDYAKGAFTNPNHFADFLAMSIPLFLSWYAIRTTASRRGERGESWGMVSRLSPSGPTLLGGMGCLAVGVLLSQSRGGLLVACLGALVTIVLLFRLRVLTGQAAGGIAATAAVALVSIVLFGDRIRTVIEANFHELAEGDVRQLDHGDARRKIWTAALHGIREYPWLGTGLSSHREVYWTYFDHPDDGSEYSHAENGYLQLTLETGLVGLTLAMLAILTVSWWCVRGLRQADDPEPGAWLAAIVGVLVVNLVHSLTDFVWYVPACMVVVALMAASAFRLRQLAASPRPSTRPLPPAGPRWGARLTAAAACLGVVCMSGALLERQWPALHAESHWFEYIRLVKQEARLTDPLQRETCRREKLSSLFAAAVADPWDCRIQMRAASAFLTLFHERQERDATRLPLTQIRDAAAQSAWESPRQMAEWLSRPGVLGEERKYLDAAWDRSRHAVALCPLLAEGYVRLGELAWIRGGTRDVEDALLRQALLVRPYDPLVHFAAGREAWLRSQHDAALEHWKFAFHRDVSHQKLILRILSAIVPPQYVLENFQPDRAALERIREAYRRTQYVDGFREVCRRLAEQLQEQAEAAGPGEAVRLWRQVHEAAIDLVDAAWARRAAEAAVQAEPNSIAARLLLGQWLYRTGDFAAAIEHLEFCRRRRPHDAKIQEMLAAATRQAHGVSPRTAVEAAGIRRLR